MSKLTKKQKEFLKGIPNKKARQEQKIQFKLQNSYNGNVVFINGKFETDLEKLAHFMNGHLMMDIMFKEDLIEYRNIPKSTKDIKTDEYKANYTEPKPLEFDLPKKVDFSSNYIDSTSKFHELILKQIQEGSDPISTINDYLINVQKFYYYKTNNKIAEITEIFPKLENKTFPNSNNENVIKIKFDASKLTNNETKSENLDFELEKSIVNLVNNITALKMQVGNFNHKGYSIVFVRDDSKIWDIQYPIRKKA